MQFKEQVNLLTQAGASCTLYDMLGAGRSSKPRPNTPEGRLAAYSPDEHYQDLKALLAMLVKGKVGSTDAADSVIPAAGGVAGTLPSQTCAQQLVYMASAASHHVSGQ